MTYFVTTPDNLCFPWTCCLWIQLFTGCMWFYDTPFSFFLINISSNKERGWECSSYIRHDFIMQTILLNSYMVFTGMISSHTLMEEWKNSIFAMQLNISECFSCYFLHCLHANLYSRITVNGTASYSIRTYWPFVREEWIVSHSKCYLTSWLSCNWQDFLSSTCCSEVVTPMHRTLQSNGLTQHTLAYLASTGLKHSE